MKRNVYGAATILALVFTLGPVMAQAQSRLDAKVPFNFTLGQKAMPAGEYEISSATPQVYEIRNLDTKEARFVMKSQNVQAYKDQNPKLVFHKYGDQYFLSQIWYGSGKVGAEFGISQREKEIRMADSFSAGPETVIVAMN